MERVNEMSWGKRKIHLLLCFVATCAIVGLAPLGEAAEDNGGVSIEWAYLATYPEADCTKIHIYVRNTTPYPLLLDNIHVGKRLLTLNDMATSGHIGSHKEASAYDYHIQAERSPGAMRKFMRKPGDNLQWCRALPNPVEPNSVTDVTVSLWGAVTEAAIRIPIRGGELRWDAKREKRSLCLSHIAFDPANPNKIYVYCENKTDKDIVIDHIVVNTERVDISKSIPMGKTVGAGKKSCFIVYPEQKMVWGRYAGVGVVGEGDEQVFAVIRIINYFPIGSWSVDTRPEMFFDSIDIREHMVRGLGSGTSDDALESLLRAPGGRTCRAYYGGEDPTCDSKGWEKNARNIISTMRKLAVVDPGMPFYTHVCDPTMIAYAYFGELPDLVFLNPYMMLYWTTKSSGPSENARLFGLARTWTDPRPVISVPEAFSRGKRGRDLTPDEVSFAMWAEIAKGAKGTRYFSRGGRGGYRGYADMPGVEDQIARDNINLQLLKNFLRIGDTFNPAFANDEKVVCQSLLCGDKGIVLILLNRDFTGKGQTASQWTPINDVMVRLDIPCGQQLQSVFEVRHGFRTVRFQSVDQHATFAVPSVDLVRVFFGRFASAESSVPTAQYAARCAQQPEVPARCVKNRTHAEQISTVVTSYMAGISRLGAPLLNPEMALSDDAVVAIGVQMHAARESAVQALTVLEEQLQQLSPESRSALTTTLATAWARIGAFQKVSLLSNRIMQDMPNHLKERMFRSLARLLSDSGRYYLAAEAFERALAYTAHEESRVSAMTELAAFYDNTVGNGERAIRCAEAALNDCETSGRLPSMHFRMAYLLLKAERPQEAIEHLLKVPSERLQDMPVDYFLGLCYAEEGRLDMAERHLRRAVARNDTHAHKAQFLIGRLLIMQQEYTQAREALCAVYERFPGSNLSSSAKQLVDQLSSFEKEASAEPEKRE